MEHINNKQLILLVSPLIAVFLSIVALSNIKFKPYLSQTEQELLAFSHEKVQIIRRLPIEVPAINSPIEVAVSSKKGYPHIPLSDVAPQESEEEIKVSFILINSKRRMAIIDGMVVNEGDIFNQKKVAKIEKNRVLINDEKGERWIRIE